MAALMGVVALSGCDGTDDPATQAADAAVDAGPQASGGSTASEVDAGQRDAGRLPAPTPDASQPDEMDAARPEDMDASQPDPTDATMPDGGEMDASTPDASSPEPEGCLTGAEATRTGALTLRTQADVDALLGVRTVQGRVTLEADLSDASKAITDLSPLGCLSEVTQGVVIQHNPALLDVSGLDALLVQTLASVRFAGPNCLTNAEATHMGDLMVTTQAEVDALVGLGRIEGSFVIREATPGGITSLASLTCLTEVTRALGIMHNRDLVSLNGLENLSAVSTASTFGPTPFGSTGIFIKGNGALQDLAPLGLSGDVMGMLEVRDNPALLSLHGLEGVTYFDGHVWIVGNASLVSLAGLDGLGVAGSSLYIGDNPSLTSVDGLGKLDGAYYDIEISGNPQLVSLSGMPSLTFAFDGLRIYDNAALPVCEADALSAQLGTACSGITLSSCNFLSRWGRPCSELSADVVCSGQCDCTGNLADSCAGTPSDPGARCTDGAQNGAETDIDCGGDCATGCAERQLCAFDKDCQAGLLCVNQRCAAAPPVVVDPCQDGERTPGLNGAPGERGVDCGGSCALGCPDGTACTLQTDCASRYCDQGTCAPKPVVTTSCNDGVQNGAEPDVDCGAQCATRCAVGQGCFSDRDCASRSCGYDCSGGTCVAQCRAPSCTDGRQSGAETGIDCGGPDCQPCACTIGGRGYQEGWAGDAPTLCLSCQSQVSTDSWSPMSDPACTCQLNTYCDLKGPGGCQPPCAWLNATGCYDPGTCDALDGASCVANSDCMWEYPFY